MKRCQSLLLAFLFTFFPFVSAYDYRHITLCDAEIFVKVEVTDDVTPLDSCENFANHVDEHFQRVASELYKSSNKRLAITKFIVDVPSSWKYSCYHDEMVTSECRRHHILLTDQPDPQPFIHPNLACDNYGKYWSLVISYRQLSRYDLPSQVWKVLEYRYLTNKDVDVCDFMASGPEQKLSDQRECSSGFKTTVQLSSYQYYNESFMTLDIKTETDRNVFKLTLKPKLSGHWLDNIKVSATIKLGTRNNIIHADKQGNGNFGMKIGNHFGPGTYQVSFHVQGTDARWYPDVEEQHCESKYIDPKFVHVGTFNWEYPSTEEYTFTPENLPVLWTRRPVNVELTTPKLTGEESSDDLPDQEPPDNLPDQEPPDNLPEFNFENQHDLKTQRPIRVKPTTPKLTDEEPPNDPQVLYIVAPIVVLAVVFILSYIFCHGKNRLKSRRDYDEDSEEGGGSENENEDSNE